MALHKFSLASHAVKAFLVSAIASKCFNNSLVLSSIAGSSVIKIDGRLGLYLNTNWFGLWP